MDTNKLLEKLETIDSKIKYYEKLFTFYKTNETNTEDIIGIYIYESFFWC